MEPCPSSASTTTCGQNRVWLGTKYLTCTIGVLLLYGNLQERILFQSLPGEHFRMTVFLVFSNRLAAITFTLFQLHRTGESVAPSAPVWKYLAISLSGIVAAFSQVELMMYVSYAWQFFSRSFKMIPVMICSMAIAGKRFSEDCWWIAIFMSVGLYCMYAQGSIWGPATTFLDPTAVSTGRGYLCLLLYLASEAFGYAFQEHIFAKHATTVYNQMLFVNLGAIVFTFLRLLLYSNNLTRALVFSLVHPLFFLELALLCAISVGGQWLVFSQIKHFGGSFCALTMTLRQVAAVLCSQATAGFGINCGQYFGLLLVLGSVARVALLRYGDFMTRSAEEAPLLDKEDNMPACDSTTQAKEDC